jgi:hypothetical protein
VVQGTVVSIQGWEPHAKRHNGPAQMPAAALMVVRYLSFCHRGWVHGSTVVHAADGTYDRTKR